jgi:hypothetical protein
MNDGELSPEAAVPDKKDWPRTSYGTIDWEPAFEHPETGLITLVERAATMGGVLACCTVIIRALFSRQDDAETRVDYERRVNEAMSLSFDGEDDGASDDETRKERVIALLREIKDIRVERAEFHIARIKMGIDTPVERREAAADDGSETSPERDPGAEADADISAPDAFIEALSQLLAGRLEALREEVRPGPIAGRPPPFPVSEAFAGRLDDLIRREFAPAMMDACRPFIVQAERKEPGQRIQFILENMEERRSREILWESWRIVWQEKTSEQELPKKPKEEKKSLLGKLKKSKPQPSWMGEKMTVEEWHDEVARIKRANKDAERIWAEITAPADDFQPPDDNDHRMLMNLFARTAGAMRKQITAVRQIATQGGNPGKVFADYQQGKDIDLPLLCACCQRPEMFLDKGLLKDFLRSFPDTMKRDRFRLSLRFFPDFL